MAKNFKVEAYMAAWVNVLPLNAGDKYSVYISFEDPFK